MLSERWHGTGNGYEYHRCRCDACRFANKDRHRRWIAARRSVGVPAHVHGTANGYTNYGCRCESCTEANRIKGRVVYSRRKARR